MMHAVVRDPRVDEMVCSMADVSLSETEE